MKVKIFKRHYIEAFGIWMPYLVLRCENITEEEYAKMHAESEYANYRYEIIK